MPLGTLRLLLRPREVELRPEQDNERVLDGEHDPVRLLGVAFMALGVAAVDAVGEAIERSVD